MPTLTPRRLAAVASLALAVMGTEQFGNAPVPANDEWAAGVLAVANDAQRCYARWINGNEEFFFSGDAAAASRALAAFAEVEAAERIAVLLPGRGLTHSFEHKPVAYDWRLHAPSGIYLGMARAKRAPEVLAVHASLELRIHGDLLASRLEIPRGLRVLGPTELFDRYRRGLEHEDATVRSQAALLLGPLFYVPGVVETLVATLDDGDAHVRQCAALALVQAASAAPAARALERCRDRATGQERAYLEQQVEAWRAAAKSQPDLDPEVRARHVEAIRDRLARHAAEQAQDSQGPAKQQGERPAPRTSAEWQAEAERRALDLVLQRALTAEVVVVEAGRLTVDHKRLHRVTGVAFGKQHATQQIQLDE